MPTRSMASAGMLFKPTMPITIIQRHIFYSTEIIAQNNRTLLESGKTVWHFSILRDELHPLNYKHEYQIVFIEPDDGSKQILPTFSLNRRLTMFSCVGHVFGVKVGSSFTIPTASKLPTATAHNLEVLDHALNVVYSTSFDPLTWHNFAVQVSPCYCIRSRPASLI